MAYYEAVISMVKYVQGVYKDGRVELEHPPEGIEEARVVVTFLTDADGQPPSAKEKQAHGQPVEAKFHQLASRWRDEVSSLSSLTQISLHPAYQQIIGLGPAVIPLLLRELEQRPDHWFWALKAITGEDPVKPEHRGRLRQMAEDWLRWGREHGYAWQREA